MAKSFLISSDIDIFPLRLLLFFFFPHQSQFSFRSPFQASYHLQLPHPQNQDT